MLGGNINGSGKMRKHKIFRGCVFLQTGEGTVKELKTMEDRVNWLAEELLLAKEEVAGLACRIEALERGRVVATASVTPPPREPLANGHEEEFMPHPLEAIDDSWAHLGQAVLLPRLAAVSFMLVIALILRTLTDNGALALFPGSLLGMVYAVVLIVSGVWLYSRKSLLAPVFPTCGSLLLYAIILETQSHFSSLSGQTGYLLLLGAELSIVLVGLCCRAKTLLLIAVIASTGVGMAVGFPNPTFSLLGVVILLNAIAAHLASVRQITHSLRWYGLVFSSIFWMLWAYKLNFALQSAHASLSGLDTHFFFPLLFAFWSFYTYSSLWQIIRRGAPLGVFHHLLPSVVAGGTFFVVEGGALVWGGTAEGIGLMTVLISALYLGLVTWLIRRRADEMPGAKEYVTAATILLIQGLSFAVPSLWALPVWTVAAAILTLGADRWQSGGIRVIAYLFQMVILLFALRHEALSVRETAWPLGLLVASGMTICTLWLYRWCRQHPPDYDSAFFTVFDRGDYSAVSLLVLGLFYGFSAASFAVAALLPVTGAEAIKAFDCAQSVILNLGIVLCLFAGLKQRNREMLVVAGIAVLVAVFKVFLFDLFRAHGVPLVSSVFSFGVVAAASSLVMRRWQGKVEEGL